MNEPHDPTAASAADRTATHPGSGVAYVYTFPFEVYDKEADLRSVSYHLASRQVR